MLWEATKRKQGQSFRPLQTTEGLQHDEGNASRYLH